MSNEPDFKKVIDVKAYLYNEFGVCGCFELEYTINTIVNALEWAKDKKWSSENIYYTELYNDTGLFYIVFGQLDRCDLIEHGTSIRCPWLTEKGKDFLSALKKIKVLEIDNDKGLAYDGVNY